MSLQVLLDARTTHRFCITGIITCCATIAYWAEPLDPYDHSIGEGADCDDETDSASVEKYVIDVLRTEVPNPVEAAIGAWKFSNW